MTPRRRVPGDVLVHLRRAQATTSTASLGSCSATFRQIVGETPSDFQRRYAAAGNPRIPGCYVCMAGLVERSATQEKHPDAERS